MSTIEQTLERMANAQHRIADALEKLALVSTPAHPVTEARAEAAPAAPQVDTGGLYAAAPAAAPPGQPQPGAPAPAPTPAAPPVTPVPTPAAAAGGGNGPAPMDRAALTQALTTMAAQVPDVTAIPAIMAEYGASKVSELDPAYYMTVLERVKALTAGGA